MAPLLSAIAAGGEHSLALLKHGTVRTWGNNAAGQLGEGSSEGPEACGAPAPCGTIPVAVSRVVDAKGVAAVKFGTVDAASFTVTSPTSITAVSPPHTRGTVDVTVTNIWGTSAISEGDHFRYRR